MLHRTDPREPHRYRSCLVRIDSASACGGGSSDGPGSRDDPSAQAQGKSTQEEGTSGSATESSALSYEVLPEADLEAALLTIQDVPVGYSQDPPVAPTTKTFCDYKVPFTETAFVRRDFTKGGGMSSEFFSVGLRQYESEDQAQESFDALVNALSTCTGETYNGAELAYAPLAPPKVGDGSVGVQITADGVVLLQNFALVGPSIVSTGGGGLIQSDADEIASLLGDQVETYQAAAAQ